MRVLSLTAKGARGTLSYMFGRESSLFWQSRARDLAVSRNYLFLVPLFLLVCGYEAVYLGLTVRSFRPPASEISRPFNTDGPVVIGLDRRVAALGLRPGDRILSINGHPFSGNRVLFEQLRVSAMGPPFTLVVRSGSAPPRTVILPPEFFRLGMATAVQITLEVFLSVLLLGCVLVGIYVAAVLPYDLRAIVVFCLMVSTSQVIALVPWYRYPRSLWVLALVYKYVADATWGLWLVLFPLYFPQRFRWDVRRPLLKWLFLGPVLGFTVATVLGSIASYWNFGQWKLFQSITDEEERLFLTVCITFFFAALGAKIRTTTAPDSKRRLRVLMAGSTLGLLPLAALATYQAIAERNQSEAISLPMVLLVCCFFFLFPLTLAYVVVAERAMNVRMVIRQGIRYGLAKGGIQALGGLVLAAVIYSFSNVIFGSSIDSPLKLGLMIVVPIIFFRMMRSARSRLQTALDRRFFREAYNAERILEELGEDVFSLVQERELLDTVSRRISETLHVPRVAVLLRREQQFLTAYSLGPQQMEMAVLPVEGKAVALITEAEEPARIYFDRRDNWVHQLPEEELVTLKTIHAQLLLPIGTRKRLLGILSLGPKLSEEPYSSSDLRLLRSVMTQTGLALENTRLTAAVAEEVAQRERLNREIEIAREVQERLYPQKMPLIAGIDYFGACRPALTVGGDYYDFLPLANGELGIAIGDVSGKGIAAALLMASLQASLRGQALSNQGDLARLMINVNQLVFETTPVNRYATFFYGQYNRERRTLNYVNAGHNAPIVLRHLPDSGVNVVRLETGGPVVGLLPDAPYEQGTLCLEPGDVFVGFTDGVSEAMNHAEEEWGEDRLIPMIALHCHRCAAELIPILLTEADKFANGAPQHDDMTLVVVKMVVAA